MSAHVLLNLLNEFGKRDKMRGFTTRSCSKEAVGSDTTTSSSLIRCYSKLSVISSYPKGSVLVRSYSRLDPF